MQVSWVTRVMSKSERAVDHAVPTGCRVRFSACEGAHEPQRGQRRLILRPGKHRLPQEQRVVLDVHERRVIACSATWKRVQRSALMQDLLRPHYHCLAHPECVMHDTHHRRDISGHAMSFKNHIARSSHYMRDPYTMTRNCIVDRALRCESKSTDPLCSPVLKASVASFLCTQVRSKGDDSFRFVAAYT